MESQRDKVNASLVTWEIAQTVRNLRAIGYEISSIEAGFKKEDGKEIFSLRSVCQSTVHLRRDVE